MLEEKEYIKFGEYIHRNALDMDREIVINIEKFQTLDERKQIRIQSTYPSCSSRYRELLNAREKGTNSNLENTFILLRKVWRNFKC